MKKGAPPETLKPPAGNQCAPGAEGAIARQVFDTQCAECGLATVLGDDDLPLLVTMAPGA